MSDVRYPDLTLPEQLVWAAAFVDSLFHVGPPYGNAEHARDRAGTAVRLLRQVVSSEPPKVKR